MFIRNIQFLLLLCVLLASPGRASAQRDSATSGKKAEIGGESKNAPTPQIENWGVLDDLKTGLQLRTADTVQMDEQPDYVRELVRVQWRLHDPIDMWVIRPKVAGKVPVILYLYDYLDPGDRFRDNGWGKRATSGGFAAVGFVSALTDYRFRFRSLRQSFVSELAESLGTTVHDVQLILNYLSERGDMDMNHVGMFGAGSGASIAILAAHADPRIKALDVLDPWGDWQNWLKESPIVGDDERSKYLTKDFLKSVAPLDPVAYLPSLKSRSLRVQQTLTEPETPKSAKESIAAAVSDPTQVVKYEDARALLKSWEATGLSGWIKQQILPQSPKAVSEDAHVPAGGKKLNSSDPISRGLVGNGK